MIRVSKRKRLPQVHVDGRFFGFYDTLQRLDDEEQLRLYLFNARVATKLSAVLDSNVLLEAFAHAATPRNANSSRYAKRVELSVAFGHDGPRAYQVRGCAVVPFLLEKARVTSATAQNFHVLYALVHGLNAPASHGGDAALAKRLYVDACSSATFRYLHTTQSQNEKEAAWAATKDAERFQHIVLAMETIEMDAATQEAVFSVLSAVLWLGNLDFAAADASSDRLTFAGDTTTTTAQPIAVVVQELLALASPTALESLLLQRRVDMASTGETFAVSRSAAQARHARDTLARFLYDTVFHFVVAQLNDATRCDGTDGINGTDGNRVTSVHTLSLVDMCGFESFSSGLSNSLEQLCINYMTEKLAAAELQLVASQYATSSSSSSLPVDVSPVLQLLEHPLGVFATLEEQTVLHQRNDNDNDANANANDDHDQKKNALFVRYLYQRNATRLLPQPSQLAQHALLFVVPHARDVVTYDAYDFVNKNADFASPAMRAVLNTTENTVLQAMLRGVHYEPQTTTPTGTTTATTRAAATTTGSLTTQVRAQIQHHISQLDAPLFLHCFRANASSAYTSAPRADVATLEKQVRAHRLASLAAVTTTQANTPTYHDVTMDKPLFSQRYACLALGHNREDVNTDACTSLCRVLDAALRNALDLDETDDADTKPCLLVATDHAVVRVRSLPIAETLELLLAKRQFEAATRIQATVRMVRARRWFTTLQTDRRELTRALLELYGPESTRKVERTLRKYAGGRERELWEKITAKQHEQRAIAELTHGLGAFWGADGTSDRPLFDPLLLENVLRDHELQRQIAASDGRVVRALREMSLDPQHVLPRQLADATLRAFYERVLTLLHDARATQPPTSVASERDGRGQGGHAGLEDTVRRLVATHKAPLHALARASDTPWAAYADQLDEIGDAPEMLLFYADDDAFVDACTAFVTALDAHVTAVHRHEQDVPSATAVAAMADEKQATATANEELLRQLTGMTFDATLLAAMQGDPFFVDALQSPQVVAAVHQLMTDRDAFTAAAGGLRSPLLSEFFRRLVRLAEETRHHR